MFDFVRFSKTDSDTTIEPNFDERIASGIWKLVGITKKQSDNEGDSVPFLLYNGGKFRGSKYWFLLDIPFMIFKVWLFVFGFHP